MQPMAKMFLQLAVVVLAALQFGAAHETSEVPVVVVSRHQLRKDIRKEVTAVVQQTTANITDSIHQVTRKVDWAVTDFIAPLRDEITAQVNAALEDAIADVTDAVELLLKPLMDQLTPPPGKTSTNPAPSCEEVKFHNRTAPSGYYWIQNSAIPLVQVFCKMDEVEILLGKDPAHPASSCKEIKEFNPGLPTGYYWIKAGDESSIRVYCDMDRTCGGITGGWMRVANVDMKNTSEECPQGLREITKETKRLCTKNITSRGCSSATFDVYGTQFTHVCGKVIGFQYGTPEAFYPYYHHPTLTIDDAYVNGVILTHRHGMNPRKHIWTFAATTHHGDYNGQCPCVNTRAQNTRIPPWVGSDYFCDTGYRAGNVFHPDDPLWDGEGCGPTSSCCSFNSPPWFSKQLPSATTDNIELRTCTDQPTSNEDAPIESVELYIQ